MVAVSVTGSTSFEGTSSFDPNFLNWTISLDGPATGVIDVEFRLLAGSAAIGTSTSGGADIYGNLESFVRFQPGETSKTVSYRIDADNVDEVDEAVVLEVFDADGATLAGGAPVLRSTGFVLDDDGTGTDLAAFVSRPVLVEGNSGQSAAAFEVTLSRPAPSDFTVNYQTVDGTATAGEDYTATSGSLGFVEGQTSSGITVPVNGDTKLEPTETFTLDVARPGPAAAISAGSGQILDDDAGGQSTPTVSVTGSTSFEGTSSFDPNFLNWTISLDGPATGVIDVEFRLLAGSAAIGTSTSGGADIYGNLESFVRFQPGETSKTVSYRIDADNVDEVDEAVVLEVFDADGATLAGGAPVLRSTGFVLDDDGTGTDLAAFVSRPVLVEGNSGQSAAAFEVTLSRPAPSDFTVNYQTVDGTATAGEDYTATSGSLGFVEGQTSSGITVPVDGDTKLEPTETFTLGVARPGPAAAISAGSGQILDDDAGGQSTPTVSVTGSTSFEGTSSFDPNFLNWTISLDGPATGVIDVEFRLLAGSAAIGTSTSGGADIYGNLESFVRFQPGETSKTVSYRIDADNVDEVDEAVVLEVFDADGATLAGGAPVLRSTGFVLDDDGTGTDLAAFVSRPVLVEGNSGQSAAAFEVTLSRPAPSDFTVNYQTVDGTATAGEDYTATSGSLGFVEGQTSSGITVPVDGDTKLEPTETFTLGVARPGPAAAISAGSAEIRNDDTGEETGGGNGENTATSGGDELTGSDASEVLLGFAGNDTISGGGGNDTIDGGLGFDVLSGENGNDRLIGGNGFDKLFGGAGEDSLEGSFGNDTLYGNGGDDLLNGGLGFDLMVGGDGRDTIDALDGFDTLVGGADADLLNGNAGNDNISGGSGNDRLNGGIGADTILGDSGNDTILGGNGADRIDGGAGADTLFGNAGADRLNGGSGNDLLFGGIGVDVFVFVAGNDRDTVTDLGVVDRVAIDRDLLGNAGLGQFDTTFGGDLALDFGGGDLLVFQNYNNLAQVAGLIDLI